jgi:hypothetical protein
MLQGDIDDDPAAKTVGVERDARRALWGLVVTLMALAAAWLWRRLR